MADDFSLCWCWISWAAAAAEPLYDFVFTPCGDSGANMLTDIVGFSFVNGAA